MELSSGRVRVPSFYVLEAARAATGAAVDRRTIERQAEERVETRIGWPAPADPQMAIDDTEYDLARLRPAVIGVPIPGLAAYVTRINPILARSLTTRFRRWEKAWRSVDGLTISKETQPNPLERYQPVGACLFAVILAEIRFLPVPLCVERNSGSGSYEGSGTFRAT